MTHPTTTTAHSQTRSVSPTAALTDITTTLANIPVIQRVDVGR